MPENTRVGKCVKKLTQKHGYGKSIAICQKSTKQSYKTGNPLPKDKRLYEKVKRLVYKNIPLHSAYRSGLVVKKYKDEFKKKYGPGSSPYFGKKPVKKGLSRWFKEDWKSDTGKYRYTTASSVYRPTKRVTSKTPKTFSELTPKQLAKAKREKAKTGRVKKF